MTGNLSVMTIYIALLLLHWSWKVLAEHDEVIAIRRLKNGDIFTIKKAEQQSCRRWFATDVVEPFPKDNTFSKRDTFSKGNCTVTCQCNSSHQTFSNFHNSCVTEQEMLECFNCSAGMFLPRAKHDEPLYDLSKPGRARMYFTNVTSSSNCNFTIVGYGIDRRQFAGGIRFNFSRHENSLTWGRGNESRGGSLLKVVMLCDGMTSRRDSCMLMKTNGTTAKEKTIVEERRKRVFCQRDTPLRSTNVMLSYILIGTGVGCVLLGVFVGVVACFYRRRQRQRTNTAPSISRNSTDGSRRTFKERWSSTHGKQREEPAMPAIHDVIFNGLIWDGNGGFSNHAIADPRFSFEVDYGIPVDFTNSFSQRPESIASKASTRNSTSPLTDTPRESRK